MAAHTVESSEGSWLPSVARKRRADEDVQEPRDQGTANREEEYRVQGFFEPIDDRSGAE